MIDVGSQLTYEVRCVSVFRFKIAAAITDHQAITNEVLQFDPPQSVEDCAVGLEGNRLQRVVVQPCTLHVRYNASAELSPEVDCPMDVQESDIATVPADVLTYLNPSRYCQSDLLARFAFEEFGGIARGFRRVQAICDWVNTHLEYTPGSTTATTTAADVLLQRTGVCRDYAHLAITLCRGLGIPARYVSGYAVNLQPPDFHGFMEAFLDGNWYLFDPTKLASTNGLVRIAVGRDAADVAFATFTGNAVLKISKVWASSKTTLGDSDVNAAVSTA
jgi:transglutaminase-like putative cysteine protease